MGSPSLPCSRWCPLANGGELKLEFVAGHRVLVVTEAAVAQDSNAQVSERATVRCTMYSRGTTIRLRSGSFYHLPAMKQAEVMRADLRKPWCRSVG